MEKILLIDGNSIMNRAFYGVMNGNILSNKKGVPTNAVYGFLNILFKAQEEIKPDHIAVAFDLKSKTFRHKLYSEYKATRHGMPEELKEQMPIIKNILENMNIPFFQKEEYEADDILGSIGKIFSKNNMKVYILTGDRDYFQLIDKNLKIFFPHTVAGKKIDEIWDEEKVKEHYLGLTPKDLIDLKALMGDKSDNIPGISGIGEKTALKMLLDNKSLDGVYEKIEKGETLLKGKTLEKVILGKDDAYLSKKLGEININVPLDLSFDELESQTRIEEWNTEILDIFKELEFNKFIKRFNLDSNSEDNKQSEKNIQNIKKLEELEIKYLSLEELTQFIGKLEDEFNNKGKANLDNKIAYSFVYGNDNKNEKEDVLKRKPIELEIYIENSKFNNFIYKIEVLENKKINEFLERFFNLRVKYISYDIKKDLVFFMSNNIKYSKNIEDLKLIGYLIEENLKNINLSSLIYTYLDYEINLENDNSFKQISFLEENETNINVNKKKTQVFLYNMLYLKMLEKLKELKLEKVYEIEINVAYVLAELTYSGVKVDKKSLLLFGEKIRKRIEELEKEISKIAGEDVNINSPKQLGILLFEKLKIGKGKKNKIGYKTDQETLENLIDSHPIIEKILEYRTYNKLDSTYITGFLPYINKEDDRVRGEFHQTTTATGRLSSTNPNLQNIPVRTELGRELRKIFIAKEGYVFIDADYSQIELRVLAHLSKDKEMLEAFNNGEDIHLSVASKIFGKEKGEVTKEERSRAKAVNFGIIYGISSFGLAKQIGVTPKEADDIIKKYLLKYNNIQKYMDDEIKKAETKGYTETLLGRRRYIEELKSKNFMVRSFGKRAAMNAPVQGTAADIMKIAMVNVDSKLKEEKIDANIVLQIHDEILVEARKEYAEKLKEIIKSEMENVIKLEVPLIADVEIGNSWDECH